MHRHYGKVTRLTTIYQTVRDYGVEMVTGLLSVNTGYVRRTHDAYAEEHQLEKLST